MLLLQSNPSSSILSGTDVILTCTVELSPAVVEFDLSVIMVDARPVQGWNSTDFNWSNSGTSFGRNDTSTGNYTCTATVRPQPPSTFLLESGEQLDTVELITGIILYV